MLIGLNTFPLGIFQRQLCSVCSQVSAADFACSVPIYPSLQEGELRAVAPVGSPIEIYSEEDAINVSCKGPCKIVTEIDCTPFAYGRATYSLFIHNGNVYVIVQEGRDGESFTAIVTVERDYEQKDIVFSVRITVRK